MDFSNQDFTILITGSETNDRLSESLAPDNMEIIHHKLYYAAPYEDFNGIKKFQIKMRNSSAAYGRIICSAVDISEWIGHEGDDYFIAAVKFFHDMKDRVKYIFTVGKLSENEILPIYMKLRCYLYGNISVNKILSDRDKIIEYICAKAIPEQTAQLIADIFLDSSMDAYRSLSVIDIVCDEIIRYSSTHSNDIMELKDWLLSDKSTITLLYKNYTDTLLRIINEHIERTEIRNEGRKE